MAARKQDRRSLYVVLEKETGEFVDAGFFKKNEEWFVQQRIKPSRYRIVRYVPATRKASK